MRRGAIFSLDAGLAITLGIILLSFATSFSAQVEDPSSLKQLDRVVFDVGNTMLRRGLFDSLDATLLNNELSLMTPANMAMRLRLSGSFGLPIVTNNSIDVQNSTVVAGVLPVIIHNASSDTWYYGTAELWVWLR